MLAELITERMTELGLRQHELAQKSTLSRQYISDLVAGRRGRRLTAATQAKLARALRISPTKLALSVAVAEPLPAVVEKGDGAASAALE